ncbi:MAG: PEGA domain-containing protein, partial [Myxococcota bacterium]|nr:PEGA domain-containing protein [Myxococcota bacterium]
TQAGFVKGKLSYMSPEQLIGEPLSSQSDQFALGILLWEMSTGRRYTPSGVNQAELLQRVVEEPMMPISHVQDDVPEQFDAIVQKMTANHAANRYNDCTAVAEALDDFMENQDTRLREKNVVDYVEDLAGEAIRDVVHNLEPADKNLIALLKPDFEQGTVIHYSTDHAKLKPTKDFKKTTVAIAAALCVLMIVGVLYLIKQETLPAPNTPTKQLELIELQNPTNSPTPSNPEQTMAGLEIRTLPEKAEIYIDHELLGLTPLQLKELPSNKDLLLEIRLQGYQTEKRTLSLKAGSKRNLRLKLQALSTKKKRKTQALSPAPVVTSPTTSQPAPQPTAPPPAPATPPPAKEVRYGFLTLQTTPWSRVVIDGIDQGPTPLFKIKLSAGKHKALFINKKANIQKTQNIDIAADQTTTLSIQLQ